MYQLTFDILHRYGLGSAGIEVPVELSQGRSRVAFPAKVDTGASYCIFQREHGEALGLNVEAGIRERVATVTGSFPVYGHEVRLFVLGIGFEAVVYFAASAGFPRNVLGRQGFLDQLQLGIVDYEASLYLARYGS